ncbi:hypothetical protein G6L37_03700 [Agrobacterium rubi]|nr:hypothetical protein [Agrobacterium rubi]NTF24456.1 hypothetical protein [Agrobacterium rubi]
MKWLLSLAAIATLAAPASGYSDGIIRATCTSKGGSTTHRQDLPENASAEQRLAIATAYPEDMCLFLKIADLPPEHRVPSSVTVPQEVLRETMSGSGVPDESLAAALSVLSGQDAPSTAKAATSFSNGFDRAVSWSPAEKERAKPLNLTIGIYKSMAMEDVMTHWREMQSGTSILSRMTPSMQVVGDVTMLSIENVADDDAATLCEEAGRKGAGCVAIY